MRVVLEVMSDRECGKRIWLKSGQSIRVGRTHHASFVLSDDPVMSSVHFSLSCDGRGCRLRDLDSKQGTLVNGKPVSEVVLRDADEIKAGGTTMRVHIEGDNRSMEEDEEGLRAKEVPREATCVAKSTFLHSVGCWHFQAIPEGWSPTEGAGLQRQGGSRIGSCRVTEQARLQGTGLKAFADKLAAGAVATRAELLHHGPVDIYGAEEAFETVVRFSQSSNQSLLQTQVFAASGHVVGLATFITSSDDGSQAQIAEIVSGLVFEEASP